jgi:sugar phosphate isomerase/epimerase
MPAPLAYRPAMRTDQIALQLYTVRRLVASDLPGTLAAVAAAGYRAVELAGLPPIEPAELRRLLADAGLAPIASHESIESLRTDPAAVGDRLAALGCERAIVPWMPEEDRRTIDDVRRFAADLAEPARVLADRGIGLGYHNHAFEFDMVDGAPIWDVLLAELPAAVAIELDVYWASIGGRDPATEIHAAADRVRLLHMKDRAPGSETHDAPAGAGILAFGDIVAAGRAAGVEWYVAEQDEPGDVLADIASARKFLADLAS